MDNKKLINKKLTEKQALLNKLESLTPQKHVGHPETYKAFLLNELRIVNNKLESLKFA